MPSERNQRCHCGSGKKAKKCCLVQSAYYIVTVAAADDMTAYEQRKLANAGWLMIMADENNQPCIYEDPREALAEAHRLYPGRHIELQRVTDLAKLQKIVDANMPRLLKDMALSDTASEGTA